MTSKMNDFWWQPHLIEKALVAKDKEIWKLRVTVYLLTVGYIVTLLFIYSP